MNIAVPILITLGVFLICYLLPRDEKGKYRTVTRRQKPKYPDAESQYIHDKAVINSPDLNQSGLSAIEKYLLMQDDRDEE